jgi:hypothetical protein
LSVVTASTVPSNCGRPLLPQRGSHMASPKSSTSRARELWRSACTKASFETLDM